MNKIFQKSIQYSIAFSDYVSHILSLKQNIVLQKGIHGHRNILLYKPFYGTLHVGHPRHVGKLTPMQGKLAHAYLKPPLQKSFV